MTASSLYAGAVTHRRLRPITHHLRYTIFMTLLDLDELPGLARRLFLFSNDRFNIFAFHQADHGAGERGGLRRWVETHMRSAGLPVDGGAIRVLCMPRILGHAFNPITAFYCHARDGRLVAMLYEVNNTFGERHAYLMPVTVDSNTIRQDCAKTFHVSPFMPMDMQYRFRVTQPGAHLSLAINASNADGLMIATAFAGARRPLTDGVLLRAFLGMPFLGAKVLAAIHWEAAKLWWRGLKLLPRPAPPDEPVTISLQRS